MVVVIDFGIFGLGFVLCIYVDYKRDFNKISVYIWNSGIVIINKVFMIVLINFNGKDCMSFGYDVECEFVDLEFVD